MCLCPFQHGVDKLVANALITVLLPYGNPEESTMLILDSLITVEPDITNDFITIKSKEKKVVVRALIHALDKILLLFHGKVKFRKRSKRGGVGSAENLLGKSE